MIMTAKLRIGLPKYMVVLSSEVSFDGFDALFDGYLTGMKLPCEVIQPDLLIALHCSVA